MLNSATLLSFIGEESELPLMMKLMISEWAYHNICAVKWHDYRAVTLI